MWFLRPSRDISLLRKRQKAVSYFVSLRNAELVASLQDCLKHIKNVSVSHLIADPFCVWNMFAHTKPFFNREYCLEWLQLKHQLGTGRHFIRLVQPEYGTDLWCQGNSEVTVTDINNSHDLLIITVEEHYMYLLPKKKWPLAVWS